MTGHLHDGRAAHDESPVPVLIVDDDASKRLALKAVLSPLGCAIVEADSGLAALRCVLAQDFAVILLDVRMPVMDGFETARLIRQRRQSEMTPIIFITAYAAHDIVTTDLYAEGAVDFIFAPVPPNELRAKVSVFANLFIKAERLAVRAREVRASADQLRLMTDAAPIGIFQTDSSNRYIYTNPRWSEITGIPAEAAAGQTWDAMIDAGQGAALAGERDDGAGDPSDPSDLCRRFELGQPDSASQIVLVTSNAVPDSHGGTSGWVGTLADVTTEVGVEAAMSEARDKATEASRLKSDFLANMSHEIRTPMNGVIGMTDLLLETALDTRQRDYAQTVRNSGESLLTILNDILDFSKVEAGKLEVEAIEFDLRAVVYDVVHLFAGAVQSKGLELTSVVESDIPVLVTGDPGRVRQVLTNLISNAIKFTNAGEIVVRASQAAVAGTDADTVIRFEISDTGDGIAHDDLEMVFQPFVQADMSTSRKYGGTGLGLAISGQLVALMGGDCGVSSELGTGSNFWFTLGAHATAAHATQYPPPPDRQPAPTDQQPAPTDQQPAPTDVRAQGPSTSGGPRGGRLLLAEDNLINQKVAVAMLASAGYSVDIVCDGEAAVKAIATGPYDAVLMDCQMPELNGYDATVAIRAREAPGRRTPIIAMTAGARREDRERCMAAGMDGYLAKPVSKDALLALVARFVKDDRSGSAVVPPV